MLWFYFGYAEETVINKLENVFKGFATFVMTVYKIL